MVLADQHQRPSEIGNVNDEVKLGTTEALIRYLNTLLVIIWSFRDVSDLALDRVVIHSVENFFGLLRRIIHDINTCNQILKVTTDLWLMSEGIETLSKKGNPDVQRIPTRINMAGVKLREAQVDQKESSWLTTRIEDPNTMAIASLRACCQSADINQTSELKFNGFSEGID
jgi:hypothetical protein